VASRLDRCHWISSDIPTPGNLSDMTICPIEDSMSESGFLVEWTCPLDPRCNGYDRHKQNRKLPFLFESEILLHV